MTNKVIAISGYSGSGKTTVSESLIELKSDFIYFDFGFLFRALTFYLFNELELNEDDIKKLVKSDLFLEKIKFSYKLEGNKVRIGINNHFFDDSQLFTLQMNMNTVRVGTIVGDKLTNVLCEIIDDLKKRGNVLLNARRPVHAYPNLDCHIFLKSTFEKRLERKMLMNNESYEVTKEKLLKRDLKEESNGFWETFDFTKVIDTTDLSRENVLSKVLEIIDNQKIKITYINNLTLVLGSFICNKNCPYCIAKNNKKFSCDDKLELLDETLVEFKKENIKFNRFVLSGNGEPSMYSYNDLLKIRDILLKNFDLFNFFRIHSSGNIFYEKDKLTLFEMLGENVEFEVLRVSFDSEMDARVLGYKKNYLDSMLFKLCNNIKCDIAFTDYLEVDNIKFNIEKFLGDNPNINKIRFKKLLVGDNDTTKQARWVKEHSMSDEDIFKVIKQLGLVEYKNGYKSLDDKILYIPSGDYDNDIVISNGYIEDYKYNRYDVKTLKRKYGVK